MKKKIGLVLALSILLLGGCGQAADGRNEYVEAHNNLVDQMDLAIKYFDLRKNNVKELDGIIDKIKDGFQKMDDLKMSEENEKVTDKILELEKPYLDCLENLKKYSSDKYVEQYNKQTGVYNKLIDEINEYGNEIK